MKKEILTVIRGIEIFLIFLAPKPFLIELIAWKLGFVKKNLSYMQAQGRLLRWQLWLSQFSFSIEHVQGSKNSLTDSLTREFANDLTTSDHQSGIPARKRGNSK